MLRRFLLLFAALTLSSPVSGEVPKKPLTLERITAEPALAGQPLQGGAWRDGHRFTWIAPVKESAGAGQVLWQFDALSRKSSVVLEPPPAPDGDPSQPKADKPRLLPLAGYRWNPAGTALLLTEGADLWLLEVDGRKLRRLTRDTAEEEFPVFSPDGSRVAFVRNHDLHVVDLATGKETRLTSSGGGPIRNGRLDWVYEEELAGRRSGRSFEWSPDSKAIAYLRLDESRVPEYPLVDFLTDHGTVLPQRYPKAGDPNAVPSLHVVTIDGVETASAVPSPDDVYIAPEIAWTADGASVAWTLLDRSQTRAEVKLLPRGGGPSTTLLVETDRAWINAVEAPRFLKDGSFLFLSERSGYLHVWRGRPGGSLPVPVTRGPWMVDRTWDVDEKSGTVAFVATEKDPRERHVYRVSLDGSGLKRVTEGRGHHRPLFAPGGAFFADTASDLETPPKVVVRASDGAPLATVHEQKGEVGAYRLQATELRSFHASDGALLHARLLKPADFDPARKYPVIVSVYGGPHAQTVLDQWGATSLFDQLCAERGFLVWSVDGRGSWGRGHAFETPLLKRLGETELKDQLEGVAELKKLPFVDGGRIGIWGWSYGGFLTLYAATHAGGSFRCAVAGAPVTDWKYYDAIYTERYLKLPRENPDGYRASSVVEAAGQLGTKLLILHGTSDDNVHLQQTIAFLDALTKARKDYALVLLPRQKHGAREPVSRLYANQRILEFFEKNL